MELSLQTHKKKSYFLANVRPLGGRDGEGGTEGETVSVCLCVCVCVCMCVCACVHVCACVCAFFHSRNRLLFSGLDLWSSPVEHLQQSCSSGTHTRVKVRLRTLDVVVEVVTERVDEVHCLVATGLILERAWEQDYGEKANRTHRCKAVFPQRGVRGSCAPLSLTLDVVTGCSDNLHILYPTVWGEQ